MSSQWDINAVRSAFTGRRPNFYGARDVFAVLVPLVERHGQLSLLFEVRSKQMRGQPGEVCFPGGRIEPNERPADAALRETYEEIGIPPESVERIAPLDVVHDAVGRVIYPLLGRVDAATLDAMQINPAEVDEVFFVPLQHLSAREPFVYNAPVVTQIGDDFPYEKIGFPDKNYRWGKGYMEVPIFEYGSYKIWGLTARIVRQFLSVLGDAPDEIQR